MKELMMDETVLVAGGIKCEDGGTDTLVVTGTDSGSERDPSKCDDIG